MIKLINSLIYFLMLIPLSAISDVISETTLPKKDLLKPASIEAFSMMGALNMAMGLIVVIALILGLAWVLKKYARLPGNNQVDMKVLGGLSLGTREKAILIEVENQRLLVGVTPGHIQTLHVLDNNSEKSNASIVNQSPNQSTNQSFESKLEKEMENQQ